MSNPLIIPELAAFPCTITLPVQWGVQDAFGHVNNVIYFRWFESARIDYLNRLDVEGFDVERDKHDVGPILASIKCDYKHQLRFPDNVHIGTRVTGMGNSSVQIEHAAFGEADSCIVATGESVVVVFDYARNKPVRAPDSLREAVQQVEGRAF